MPQASRRKPVSPLLASLGTTTPVILNTVLTRLRALSKGLTHACGVETISGLHVWMRSYGDRLDSMAESLQDEGAKSHSAAVDSAKDMFLEKTCDNPTALLSVVHGLQALLLADYAQLSMRLDMDEEMYALILEQERELTEVQQDVDELRLEYETYAQR